MEFAEQEILKQRYRELAEAVGVKFDPQKVEPFLKKLIDEAVKLAVKEADGSIAGFRTKIGMTNTEVSNAKKEAAALREEIKNLTREARVWPIQKELNLLEEEFADYCNKTVQQFSEKMNPFHSAVEDFLGQLEAHKFPPEMKVEPLCKFLEAMSYANWQANSKAGALPEMKAKSYNGFEIGSLEM